MSGRGRYQDDGRVDQAKTTNVREVVHRLAIPNLQDNGEWLSGPCPACNDPKAVDRFNINTRDGGFFCRKCDQAKGGDMIALTMLIMGMTFPDALTWLCGERSRIVDPAVRAKQKRDYEAAQKKQADIGEKLRKKARADAREIWRRAGADDGTVRKYLRGRGIGNVDTLPPSIRYLPNHPYVVRRDGQLHTLHRGPCMVAVILDSDGRGIGVHQTFIDLARPKGKALIEYQGQAQSSKLCRGSQKGGAIRLPRPRNATTLIVGEGIETTWSAKLANVRPGAAYWCAINLHNMGGEYAKGADGKKIKGVPDLADLDCFIPPDWCDNLIYLVDSDPEAANTEQRLRAGLARAQHHRPGIKTQWVKVPTLAPA